MMTLSMTINTVKLTMLSVVVLNVIMLYFIWQIVYHPQCYIFAMHSVILLNIVMLVAKYKWPFLQQTLTLFSPTLRLSHTLSLCLSGS
jgi:hypothetical protein